MAKTALRIILGFWVVALVGFWPTYLSRLGEVPWPGHFHGVMVFGWYALLLAQAWLIGSGRRPLHRALGKLSLVWVLALLVSTFVAARFMLGRDENPPSVYHLSIFSLIVPLMLSFAVLYVQAIRHRRNMALHARYMLGTGIIYLLPAWSRLLGIYVLPALGYFDEPPTVQQQLFGDQLGLWIMQLFTLALLVIDYRKGQPWQPWGLCLALLLAIHACLYLLPGLPAWHAFGTAVMITP